MSDHMEKLMKNRFRGFLPVVVDLETGGFNSNTDAILEIAATFFDIDAEKCCCNLKDRINIF